MSWCPKCKAEYQTGIEICNDCQESLVESLLENERHINPESFLMVVKDELEAGIIEAKLSEAEIPVLKKHPGTGEYLTLYMGYTPFGIELYVPTKALEMAREIIALEGTEELDERTKNDLYQLRESHQKSVKIKSWMLFCYFILLPLLISVGIITISYFLNK